MAKHIALFRHRRYELKVLERADAGGIDSVLFQERAIRRHCHCRLVEQRESLRAPVALSNQLIQRRRYKPLKGGQFPPALIELHGKSLRPRPMRRAFSSDRPTLTDPISRAAQGGLGGCSGANERLCRLRPGSANGSFAETLRSRWRRRG